MTVFVNDPDFVLHVGDVRDVLAGLPDKSVNCVITSPPYFGLRDYGTVLWEGGDPDCDHVGTVARTAPPGTEKQASNFGANAVMSGDCRCGAFRVDQQLGLEATPDLYVANMVAVFREVRRVLRADGTCWLNLGDSYISGQGGRQSEAGELPSTSRFDRPDPKPRPDLPNPPAGWAERAVTRRTYPAADSGLKPKDMAGMPWRVAFALQADGWWLRSDIVWSKPNPMPESVTDRPTKAHEYVFLLTKGPRYWFDQEAVREPAIHAGVEVHYGPNAKVHAMGDDTNDRRTATGFARGITVAAGRNVRSVWEIATQPYSEAHFATFPEELVRRCLLAGCPEWVCATCGKPRERIVERGASMWEERKAEGEPMRAGDVDGGRSSANSKVGGPRHNAWKEQNPDVFLGWSDCGHNNWTQGTVLDPFMGSGTTALVARRHGRRAVGVELNREYAQLSARRLQQLSLLA